MTKRLIIVQSDPDLLLKLPMTRESIEIIIKALAEYGSRLPLVEDDP